MIQNKQDKADVGVIVGRFQVPYLHAAHQELINHVAEKHGKVIILVGISHVPLTKNNPLDFECRAKMLLEFMPDATVLPIKDHVSDDVWSQKLDEQVASVVSPTQTVVLYGGRDSFIKYYSGKYNTQELESDTIISGSELRENLKNRIKPTEDFRSGVIWSSWHQFPKVITTVDIAVVNVKTGQLLVCKKPGEKLYRFIGGFSDPRSPSFEHDAKREVSEETGGIEVDNLKYLGSFNIDDWRYRKEADHIRTLFYAAEYIYGQPIASDDVSELAWKPIDKDLEKLIMPIHAELARSLIKYFGKN